MEFGATDKPCGVCTVANPKTCPNKNKRNRILGGLGHNALRLLVGLRN